MVALRLTRSDGHKKETKLYQQRCIFQAAAQIWAEGVSWSEAMDLAEKAFEEARPKGRGKGKAKGKGKRKGKS